MYLLSADWHLDDNPANADRWQVFDRIREIAAQYPVSGLFVLGDIVDKKDRHSANLVNRLIEELRSLDMQTMILRGNHDTAVRPPHYWEFLTGERIEYITAPTRCGDLLLLPFSADPKEDWREIDFRNFQAVFMHLTVTGAVVGGGLVLENDSAPELPRGPWIYSGDIHHPQQVGPVTYVGAPHHVKFGDDHLCRMLLLDEQSYEIAREIVLSPPRRHMLTVRSLDDLESAEVTDGDHVKIRISAQPKNLGEAARMQERIAAWARERGLQVAGIETIVHTRLDDTFDTQQAPEAVLRAFAESEHLTDDMLAAGLEILKEAE